MIDRNKYRYYIGIDTGTQTGFAMWDRSRNILLRVETLSIHKAMDEVKALVEWQHVDGVTNGLHFIRVEDARLREWIPEEKNIKQRIGRAKGAGSVSRDAAIWEGFLRDLRVDFELVPPKNNKTKVSATYFKLLTGWHKPTSQHSRDAAMLVHKF